MRWTLLTFILLSSLSLGAINVEPISPGDNFVTNNPDQTFVFRYVGDATATCDLYLDGNIDSSTLASNNTQETISSTIVEGAHNWHVTCTDSSSVSSADRSITVDTIPPSGSLSISAIAVNLRETVDITCSGDITVLRPSGTPSLDRSSNFKDTVVEGIYTVRCYEEDDAGNSVTNETFFEVVQRKDQKVIPPDLNETRVWDSVYAGSKVEFDVKNTKIAIRDITVFFNKSSGSIKLSLAQLQEKPDIANPSGVAYRYFRIGSENVYGNFSKIQMEFEVEKAWFAENNVTNVTLQRYVEWQGAWEVTIPQIISENSQVIRYRANPLNLSVFVITSGHDPIVEEVVTTTTTTTVLVGEIQEEPASMCGNNMCDESIGEHFPDSATYCPADCIEPESKRSYVLFIVVGIVFVLVLFFFFMK